MMGSLAESLVGAVIGEATTQSGRHVRPADASYGYQRRPQQQPGQQGPLASLVDSITELGNRALRATLRGLQYLLLFEALLLSAAVLYGALYWMVMPLRLHDKPLFFDYSDRATTGGATATVDFLARHTQWNPSSLTRVDPLHVKVLQPGQHYEVGLELQMPTSYTNRRVGVFMVHTTLLDDEDNVLATSARPAMLPHTSGLLKGVKMLSLWPLYLIGLAREADTVFVPCVDFYEENAEHPLTKARVSVSSGRVQFYRASVHITPQLKGLPWLMQDWFYSTFAAGVLFIASLEVMLIGFCYVFFFLGLEDDRAGTKDASTSKNRNGDDRRAAIRARAAEYTNVTASSASSAAPAGGSAVASEDMSRYTLIPSTTTRGPASTVAGLRRRDVGRERDDFGSSPGSDNGSGGTGMASPGRERLPRGVQAYQRGSRYVIADHNQTTSDISGNSGRGDSSLPRVSKEEELDAAAMTSWTALGGNIDQTRVRRESAGRNARNLAGRMESIGGGAVAVGTTAVGCQSAATVEPDGDELGGTRVEETDTRSVVSSQQVNGEGLEGSGGWQVRDFMGNRLSAEQGRR